MFRIKTKSGKFYVAQDITEVNILASKLGALNDWGTITKMMLRTAKKERAHFFIRLPIPTKKFFLERAKDLGFTGIVPYIKFLLALDKDHELIHTIKDFGPKMHLQTTTWTQVSRDPDKIEAEIGVRPPLEDK